MQSGVRAWVLRAAKTGSLGLRKASPKVLLSMLCAAAFGPVAAVLAGITGGTAAAGIGALSSVGGGVLGEVIAAAIDRMGSAEGEADEAQEELEREIARQIEISLEAGDARADVLRAEIAELLREIDAGTTALRAAVDAGDDKVRGEVITLFGDLGIEFTEMRFLLADVALAAAEIQESLNAQDAKLRALIHLNGMQLTEVRLTREAVASMKMRGYADNCEVLKTGSRVGSRMRECPYRGLMPYAEADAEVFYGRERMTAELVGKLASQMERGSPVVVTGASGAGKSSLLLAGLLPALARGLQLPGSSRWSRVAITPAQDPLSELATSLAALGGGDAAAIRAALASNPGHAHLAVRQAIVARKASSKVASEGDPERLVLIVDQFEQVFTLNAEQDREPERRAFITALCAAASRPAGAGRHPPALVVIAVRGDFWDQCAAYPDLADALQHGQFVVGPMTSSDLRLAFTGPADAAGLRIDPSLIDVIMSDLRAAEGDPTVGVLPLLSQAMLLTWKNREGGRLTSHGYGLAGGLSGAVQISADSALHALSAAQQAVAQLVLRSMVIAGREGRFARRPVIRSDLYAAHPAINKPQIDEVLEAFADKRLLVLDGNSAQIAHDVLLTAWPRLRGWLEEDLATCILHGQLADDAATWNAHGQDTSFLYRGTQLVAVRQAATGWSVDPGRFPALTVAQHNFLKASERATGRVRLRRRILAAVLAVLFIASIAGAGIAINSARTANRQRDSAISDQLAARSESLDGTDPVAASLLAAAAWHFSRSAIARDSLLDATAQPERAILATNRAALAVAFSPDGKTVAVGTRNIIELWSVPTHRVVGRLRPRHDRTAPVNDLAFSPDGAKLAAAYDDGSARLWNLHTRREVGAPLETSSNSIHTLSFTVEGGAVLASFEGSTVRWWALASHRQVGTSLYVGNAAVTSLAVSPDGMKLAISTTSGTRLWDAATQEQLFLPTGSSADGPDQVTFSPRGNMLATVGGSGTDLWNTDTGQRIGTIMPATSGMYDVAAFSPNQTLLAVAGADGETRLWNVADHERVGDFSAVGVGQILSVAFSPDGDTLATGDDGAQLWDVNTWRQIGARLNPNSGPNAQVERVDISRDGKFLALSMQGGPAELWNAVSGRRIRGFASETLPGQASLASFSPNGKTVAIYNGGGETQLWNVDTRRRIGAPLRMRGMLASFAFDQDAGLLAVTSFRTVQLWDLHTRRRLGPPIHVGTDSNVVQLAGFISDRTLVVVTSVMAQLWNVASHRLISEFKIGPPFRAGGMNMVTSTAFNPSRKLLAVAEGNDVRVWNLTTHRQVVTPLTFGSRDYPGPLSFGPDGKILAVQDGSVFRLFDITTGSQVGEQLTASIAPAKDTLYPSAPLLSPDGKTMAARTTTAVWLWNIAFPDNPYQTACSISAGSSIRAEWRTYAPFTPFEKVC